MSDIHALAGKLGWSVKKTEAGLRDMEESRLRRERRDSSPLWTVGSLRALLSKFDDDQPVRISNGASIDVLQSGFVQVTFNFDKPL